MLRDAVRVLADERIAPRAAEIDRTGEFPEDVKELLAAQDILGAAVPDRARRPRRRAADVCLAIEQISRACATTGLILAVQELGVAAAPARRDRRAAGPLVPGARRRASSSSRSP